MARTGVQNQIETTYNTKHHILKPSTQFQLIIKRHFHGYEEHHFTYQTDGNLKETYFLPKILLSNGSVISFTNTHDPDKHYCYSNGGFSGDGYLSYNHTTI